jgi:predicted SprT family Zn-dependent metalloprotease
METTTAAALARGLMNDHGLTDWTFQFDRAKRRFGVCSYRTRTISLSAPLVALNDEARIRNTILHEIAHALVGPGHGHGYVWRAMARSIGCDARRCCDADDVQVPAHAWVGVCPSCSEPVGKRHRLSDKARRLACRSCCSNHAGGRYDARFLLVWERQIAA